MNKALKETHFIWLTLALVGLMVTGAISREIDDSLTLRMIEFTSIVLLFMSLLSLKSNLVWTKRFVILLAFLLTTILGRNATDYFLFEYFYLTLYLVFLLLAAWLVARQVLLTGTIDLNKIVGAIALYLMLGLIWSIFYTFLLEFSPHSFNGIEAGPWYDNYPSATYFSFVTLTTLGYGDISPAKPMAEVLVVLEAVTGMFYLAIIVASLVGALRHEKQGD